MTAVAETTVTARAPCTLGNPIAVADAIRYIYIYIS